MAPLAPSSLPAPFGVDTGFRWTTRTETQERIVRYNPYAKGPRHGAQSNVSKLTKTTHSSSSASMSALLPPPPVVPGLPIPAELPETSSPEPIPKRSQWSRSSWGMVTFNSKHDKQQITTNWSYSENGPDTQCLLIRNVGDIHFSPSNGGNRPYNYWVCMDIPEPNGNARGWVQLAPGRPHPLYSERVLQANHGDWPPRWVKRRSYRTEF